jgi:hypothetical protein
MEGLAAVSELPMGLSEVEEHRGIARQLVGGLERLDRSLPVPEVVFALPAFGGLVSRRFIVLR